jgi:PAS domain S-box-containing protein
MQRREFNTLLEVAATVRAKRPTALLREVGYVLLGLVSLATVTGLYFWLDVPLVAAAFTYLVALVLLSLVSNLSSLIVLSFIGACCLSYFFAPPIYSLFRIDYPQDLITISAFVITSFVVSFLVTRVRVEQRDRLRTSQALRDANQRLEVTNDALRVENVERKCAEQALRESEHKLRQIIDTIPTHVVRYQPDGAADFINQTFIDFVGPGVGFDNLRSVVHPEDYPKRSRDWDTHVAAAEPYDIEMRLRRADGVYRWHRSRRVPLRDANGVIVNWYGAGHDIDDQKRAEQALRRSEAYLAEAQRLSHTGSAAYNETEILYWSEEAFRIFGFDPLQGIPNREAVWQRIHPDDVDRINENTERGVREKRSFTNAFRFVLPDGTVKHIESINHPVFLASGELLEIVGTPVDVTERKRTEEAYREAQLGLAHANRVATIGQLTSSIAHEVNQPITAAITYALAARRFLKAEPPNFHEVDDALSLIVKETNRAGEVVERVRALIKRAPARKDAVAIDDAILEVIALTRAEAANNSVSVRTQFAEGLPRIQGDRVQLRQVMLNLILNAIQSMSGVADGNRELQISIDAVPSEGSVRVGVRDTGPGLSPESLPRLFEPFYTTKPEGIGMGLSICRSIIEAHGGRLCAIPCEPQGALFQFTIPAD